jgi:hypothetical protein
MCCGSKRSAWRSASASTQPPRAAPMPVSVAPAPTPPTRQAVVTDAPVFASSDPFHLSQRRLDLTPARPVRRWGLTS